LVVLQVLHLILPPMRCGMLIASPHKRRLLVEHQRRTPTSNLHELGDLDWPSRSSCDQLPTSFIDKYTCGFYKSSHSRQVHSCIRAYGIKSYARQRFYHGASVPLNPLSVHSCLLSLTCSVTTVSAFIPTRLTLGGLSVCEAQSKRLALWASFIASISRR
jgi:hypothetical protein